ncbi:hypothetical protein E2C01_030892 [Portunus trituberculatus]|uniref:Uncharacterized protein n=1 Tax=Portunus trituberculatus TaxID=210409 RepID=A0A5B7EYL4_PORTR|nr:hypothetical protein [Portunus trituberculatus]
MCSITVSLEASYSPPQEGQLLVVVEVVMAVMVVVVVALVVEQASSVGGALTHSAAGRPALVLTGTLNKHTCPGGVWHTVGPRRRHQASHTSRGWGVRGIVNLNRKPGLLTVSPGYLMTAKIHQITNEYFM